MARNRVARRSFIRGVGGTRRESLWIDVVASATIIGGPSGSALLNSLNAAALALRPFTIVRTRGVLYMESDQSAAVEEQGCALGYAVVSDQASAIGITAVPTPVVDKGSDLFFVHQSLLTANDLTFFTGSGQTHMVQYDSKAMRKVNDDQDLVITLDSEIAGISLGIAVRHTARFLVKLH